MVLITLIILVSSILLILQYGKAQTFLTEKVIELVARKTDADIRFEKLHIHPFNTLLLKNVVILDDSPARPEADPADTVAMRLASSYVPSDTLLHAEYIIARLKLKQFVSKKKGEGIHIQEAIIKNGSFNLVLGEEKTNVERILGLKRNKDKKNRDKDIFDIHKVNLENFRFTMKNVILDEEKVGKKVHNEQVRKKVRQKIIQEGLAGQLGGAISWQDLDMYDINAHISDLGYNKGYMSGKVHDMNFREKSGYICNHLSGKARVGHGLTLVEDLELKDPWSDLVLPRFTMEYDSGEDFQDFLTKVKIGGTIAPSHLSFRSIGYFTASIKYVTFAADIRQASFYGPVSDLHVGDFDFEIPDQGIEARVDADISGIPELDDMRFNLDIRHLGSTTWGIEQFIRSWAPFSKVSLAGYATGTRFTAKGTGKGPLDRLELDLELTSPIGSADADIYLSDVMDENRPVGIGGHIKTRNLNLGKILSIKNIGECSLNTELSASFKKGETPDLAIDTLRIDRLRFNGYDYHNITAKGKLADNIFDGGIVCNEPNLSFILGGAFAVSPKTRNEVYKFYAKVGYIDLQALNLDKRGTSKASFSAKANFNWVKQEDFVGNILVSDLMLENAEGKHDIGDMTVSSHSSDELSRIVFKSGFADGEYTGSGSFLTFIDDINDLSLKREMPALFRSAPEGWSGNDYRLSFRFNNTMNLMGFILPGAYLADGSSINLTVDRSGLLEAKIRSQRIALNKSGKSKEMYVKDLDWSFSNEDDFIRSLIKAGEVKVSGLSLKNNSVNLMADDNHFGLEYLYDNGAGTYFGSGNLNASGNLVRKENKHLSCHVDILPSELLMNANRWKISPASIDIDNEYIAMKDFGIRCDGQYFTADGGIAFNGTDTLNINLDKVKISFLDKLMKNPLGLAGELSGTARVLSSPDSKGVDLDLVCDGAEIGKKPVGKLNLTCDWDSIFKKFDIRAWNDLHGRKTLDAEASFTPSIRDLVADVALTDLELGYITPLVKDIFTVIDGKISGSLHAEGPLKRLAIKSKDLYLKDGHMTIGYTQVPYSLDGDLGADEYGLYFKKIDVRDELGGRGRVEGKLYYDHFKDMGLDLYANLHRIRCIDLTEKDNEYFYGNLTASGDLTLKGKFSALQLEVNAVTNDEGNLHIPIKSSATAGSTNLLKFKEVVKDTIIDPYELMVKRMEKKKAASSDFGVKIRATATPQVTAFIEIDKASGNVLTGKGEGNIDLNIRKDLFDIRGDYAITSGNYKFVALGLASRDFSIQDGSTVKFNGDIMSSVLDIDAIYRTKTSLSTLISDTSSVNTRKIVECGINITDKLSNPRLKFSIDVPDIDPTIQSKVKNALSTDDKIQKQFLSLILSNSFLPDEQSGISNNSAVLYSNVSEIMSNQLNNILQKLNIPLDLGLDYQPNEKGKDIFDVAVSTQLFNNRVVVNGNIGNRQYSNSNTNSDVVGDLDIEVKLDKSGALRLNLFSHSADQYTNYLDNSQRNGVGLTYQKEFDSLKDLFMSKKRRKEQENLENSGRPVPTKKIIIGKEENKKTRRNGRKERKASSDTLSAGRE